MKEWQELKPPKEGWLSEKKEVEKKKIENLPTIVIEVEEKEFLSALKEKVKESLSTFKTLPQEINSVVFHRWDEEKKVYRIKITINKKILVKYKKLE
jgi:hypothetical protein